MEPHSATSYTPGTLSSSARPQEGSETDREGLGVRSGCGPGWRRGLVTATDAEPRGAAKPPCVGSPHTRRGLQQGRRRGRRPGQQPLPSGPGCPALGLLDSDGAVDLSTGVAGLRVPPPPLAAPPCFPTEMTPMTPQASPVAVRERSSIQALAQQLPERPGWLWSPGSCLGFGDLRFNFHICFLPLDFLLLSRGCGVCQLCLNLEAVVMCSGSPFETHGG